jgi:PhnB protein
MASRLNPYLSFPGTAREAMEFYQSVFGGNLRMSTFGEFGAPDEPHADKVMHAMLETDNGFTLMASDTVPGMKDVTVGDNVVVSISGDDADDLREYWEKLSAKGTVQMPLEKQVWGDEYGALQDQFGTNWMIDITPPQG